jgi:hypothetical protein
LPYVLEAYSQGHTLCGSYGELSGARFNASAGNPNGMGSYCLERFLEPDTLVAAPRLAPFPALLHRVVGRAPSPNADHLCPNAFFGRCEKTQKNNSTPLPSPPKRPWERAH